jgi:hypothetical protein
VVQIATPSRIVFRASFVAIASDIRDLNRLRGESGQADGDSDQLAPAFSCAAIELDQPNFGLSFGHYVVFKGKRLVASRRSVALVM